MKLFLKSIGIIGLLLTILPSFGVFYALISHQAYTYFMFLGTILWFGSGILLKGK
jgi:hypothetical protein